MNPQRNAITRRLEKLRTLYGGFYDQPESLLCHWQIQEDESRMLEAFYASEDSDHGVFPDVFIRFTSPFAQGAAYNSSLNQEFLRILGDSEENMQKEGVPSPDLSRLDPNRSTVFQYLTQFAQGFPAEWEGRVVAFLDPTEIAQPRSWEDWLIKALETGLPSKIRLMVAPTETQCKLSRLQQQCQGKVLSVRPELDMDAAMAEMAADGDPNDPGVQFRQLFVQLGQAIQRNNLKEAQSLGEKALDICKKQDWPSLAVTIHVQLAGASANQKDMAGAQAQYAQAKNAARSAATQDLPLSQRLLTQVCLFEGGLHMGNRDHYKALQSFEEAITNAKQLGDPLMSMEALRLAGYSAEQEGHTQKAWDYGHQALDEAATIQDENLRHNSTLPYVGQSLRKLVDKLGRYTEEPTLLRRLSELAGPDWEKRLLQTKSTPA